MVGLFSAYYLSGNPDNKVVVLEKLPEPYQGTSRQNGNWLSVNYGSNLLDQPLYPWVYRAIFDNENFVSKVYTRSFFESFENVMITAKFGFKWLFFQPSK